MLPSHQQHVRIPAPPQTHQHLVVSAFLMLAFLLGISSTECTFKGELLKPHVGDPHSADATELVTHQKAPPSLAAEAEDSSAQSLSPQVLGSAAWFKSLVYHCLAL